jgi:hypothetical protein
MIKWVNEREEISGPFPYRPVRRPVIGDLLHSHRLDQVRGASGASKRRPNG